MRTLVWFRGKDLRIADHAPLAAARGGEVVCLFVVDPFFFAPKRARELPHRMQFLLESIAALGDEIERLGSRLFFVAGKSVDVVPRLVRRWKIDRVVAQRWTEPFARERDARVARAIDVPFDLFEGETLAPPGSILNAEGRPFSVYSAFARAHRREADIGAPIPTPRSLPPPPRDVASDATLPSLVDLGITTNPRLPKGGSRAARDRLSTFLRKHGARYHVDRDRMDLDATSRLSVDLKFGTISPRTVWRAAEDALAPRAWQRFGDQLLWREFAHAVLFHDPKLLERPHRAMFEDFPWEEDERGWRAWCDGTTGYPLVDAAARQLLAEGFVHNRARMVAASFLTKHLRIDYRRGEAHYMKWLVDGDWANNNFGWQWTTGCGFDAAPYFRVFNPIEQAKKFDPDGGYVKRWLPSAERREPIVDHREARARYLAITAERTRSSTKHR